MPRGPRITLENGFFHVFNRGVAKQKIFLDEQDYRKFLTRLQGLSNKKGFDHSIYVYCLMPNHFHLLIQTRKVPISKLLSSLTTSYSMYFNHKYNRVGPLFQNRFKSKLCDRDSYFLGASRYILLNPIESGLVSKIEDYPWSSYQEIFGSSPFSIIDRQEVDRLIPNKREFFTFLKEGIIILDALRETYTFDRDISGSARFNSLSQKKFLRRYH